MKGERLFVKRQIELLEHVAEEKDSLIKLKLVFLKCFSSFGRDLAAVCQVFWDSDVYRLSWATPLK